MKQGLFLFISTLLVNVLNYALNIFLARWLGPVGFSEANIIATLVLGLSFAAMGLQLTAAKLVAEDKMDVYKLLLNRIRNVSVGIAIVLILSTPVMCDYLNFESVYPLVILFAGIPFYFLMSIVRGKLQGRTRFANLGWTYVIEGLTRTVVTLGLLLAVVNGLLSTVVVSCGFLASFVVTWIWSRGDVKHLVPAKSLSGAGHFLFIMAIYELSQVLINNSDVILVKHFFSAEEAGLYASLALLGKAVFFATWAVVTVLFPKVIEKEKMGLPHIDLFYKSLLIVAGLGLCMVLGSYYFGDIVLGLAFGSVYSEMADGLWIYALLTCCFACANVFVYYNLSLERYWPVFISIGIGLAQIFFINLYHQSLREVIVVQLCMMVFFLVSMFVYQFSTINFNKIATVQTVDQIQ